MTEFDAATELVPAGEGSFAWKVPEGWLQGRGVWGGLITGAVANAVATADAGADRALRTVSIHMSGPVPAGLAAVRVEPLRIGSGMSTWSVTIRDASDDLCVHAVAITGKARALDLAPAWPTMGTVRLPALPGWEQVPVLEPAGDDLPDFIDHLEFRVVDGVPHQGASARCSGYVRFRDRGEWSAASLLSIVDAWWPTAWTALPEPRPGATVSYAAHLLADPRSVPSEAPLAFESFMSGAHDGFTTETRRLWSGDGSLVVENHQSIVVIR